jgi:hypothetical protein
LHGKKSGFVDSGFVKTCEELVIEHGRVGHISFPIPDDLPTLKDYEAPKSGWQVLKKKIPKLLTNIFHEPGTILMPNTFH